MWNNTWHYGSLAGKIYAPIRFWRARQVFKYADAVLYVTSQFLQKRYPTLGLSDQASDVQIDPPDPAFLESRLKRIENMEARAPLTFGIIGPVHHTHKGIDTAMTALARWSKETETKGVGRSFSLRILGRGDPSAMTALANDLGIENAVFFDGLRPSNEVKNWLDDLDIYLQPSRTEGLPRATLEAMSRALPVITSDAGDMPSLIDPRYVHHRANAHDLAETLKDMCRDQITMAEQAKINFETIKTQYHPDTLKSRRDAFWDSFIDLVKNKF
jgi:glycosyltransferase involved in cell wall biosynthesis